VWDVGSEVLLEQMQLNFSFRNKFIILLPFGLLIDNNTFSKMCVFKSLTGYTDYGGYVVKRESAYTHIRVNDHIVVGRSVFVLDFHPRPAAGVIPFLVHSSKIVNYHNAVAEDI
jgi:hypothetical protein